MTPEQSVITVEHNGYVIDIYLCQITPADRTHRRQAERQAIGAIIKTLTGADIYPEHLPSGQPYIPGANFHISISHSTLTAALGVSRTTAVGIDIEQPRQALFRTASRFLSDSESALCTTPQRLLMAWTAKEATFKCAGIESLLISDIIYPAHGDFSQAMITTPHTSEPRLFHIKHIAHGEQLIAIATPIVNLP
ncbi:MAG: 4'-phosphopantetheinyl transferase superfamily protein [Paramuribaculum sp.]|nr:4'-phosphopantetheinyl transferase superfamily protein [Paramuribaculum sp.]